MEDDDQLLSANIQNLQNYCNSLKNQGYNDSEINQILQKELRDQQEEFLNQDKEVKMNKPKYQFEQGSLNQYYPQNSQIQSQQQQQFNNKSSSNYLPFYHQNINKEEDEEVQNYEDEGDDEGIFEAPSDSHFSRDKEQAEYDMSKINERQLPLLRENNSFANQQQQQNVNSLSNNVIKGMQRSSSAFLTTKQQPQKLQQASQQGNMYSSSSTSRLQQQNKPLTLLKKKLRTVFTFYVSFGDRINVTYLKSNKFHKMMSDALLKDSSVLTSNKLDLMFVKQNCHKPNMDFNTFLDLITQIASLKFPNQSPPSALQLLLQNHFIPLYDNIIAETDLGQDHLAFNEPMNQESFFILKEVQNVILHIYCNYFSWEQRNCGNQDEVISHSETQIFQFLRDFEICPALVTKSTAFLLFRELLDTPSNELCRNNDLSDLSSFLGNDLGLCFSFWRFSVYLIRLAEVCYSNLFNQLDQPTEGLGRSSQEKTTFLLERMELSQGFLKLNKKGNSQLQSLILKKRFLSNGASGSAYSIQNQGNMNQQYSSFSSNQNKNSSSNLQQLSNENSSVSQGRLQRSKSDLRLKQPSGALTSIQQEQIRNYSPMSYISPQDALLNQQRNLMIAHIEQMKNFKLLINPLGLVELKCVDNLYLLDNYCENLLIIFQSYCSFGDAMNTTSLTSSKFVKLLREAGLVLNGNKISDQFLSTQQGNGKILSPNDADLIFVKVASKKKKGELKKLPIDKNQEIKQGTQRLDFEQFLVALEMVSKQFYQLVETSSYQQLNRLLLEHILPLCDKESTKRDNSTYRDNSIGRSHFSRESVNSFGNNSSQHNSSQGNNNNNQFVTILLDILKNKDIVDLLELIHKTMVGYFKFYSESKTAMEFEKFAKFCKDFGIFPAITSKQRLLKIFNTLAQIYSTADQYKQNSSAKPVIDQHLFIEAIALCAFEISYQSPEPSDFEKICLLIERMNQSGGQQMITKHTGHTRSQSSFTSNLDIALPLRKKYPQFFQKVALQASSSTQSQNQTKQNNNGGANKKGSRFDDFMKENLNMY